jgi:hypothetical protein
MISTALLTPSLSAAPQKVVATLKPGADYASFAKTITAKFPRAAVQRGFDHELLKQLEEKAAEERVDVGPQLVLMKRFVAVTGENATELIGFVQRLPEIEPGAHIETPAVPAG